MKGFDLGTQNLGIGFLQNILYLVFGGNFLSIVFPAYLSFPLSSPFSPPSNIYTLLLPCSFRRFSKPGTSWSQPIRTAEILLGQGFFQPYFKYVAVQEGPVARTHRAQNCCWSHRCQAGMKHCKCKLGCIPQY